MLLRKMNRPIFAITCALAAVVLFFSCSGRTLAQTSQPAPPQPEAGVDDNPTRAVFFSVREEYRNLKNGAWNNRLILRKDKVVLKGKHLGGLTGFLLRTDVPITTTHQGTETHTGLGDIYGQALYIPYLSRKFAFVTGSGLVLPTATNKTLGQGKWQLAPLAVPVWFLSEKKGYFYVKFQDYFSIAGVGDRPNVNALFIAPTVNYIPARRWLVQADAESRTNWKNGNRTDFRAGFGAGRVMTHRLFLGLKCEVPFGATRSGDWTIKITNIFYPHRP
ncbi:MAG TPA: hypothetical protein VGN90_06280 [Pyrinomonadaceae bacterium]|jgi:hypothetical protein|nr:hypothetical protein [Pyrinomonadaceae bacterium]